MKGYLLQKTRMNLLSKCLQGGQVKQATDLDHVLRILVGDYMKQIYSSRPRDALGQLHQCCTSKPRGRVSNSRANLPRNIDENDSVEELIPEVEVDTVEDKVYRDLFFWAILTNRIEMAQVFLSYMKNRICAALIASKVFKSYISYAQDNESKELLTSQGEQFETYANECLKSCYNYEEETACEIAIRRINLFGSVTCLQVLLRK